MAFGMQTSGSGDITPFVKYNAKAGRMVRVDRVQGSNGYESQDIDITDSFQAVVDLPNILVGYIYYGPQGPQRAMGVYKREPTPACPPDVDDKGKRLYKSGFTIRMALAKSAGGGIREFGSSAACVVEAMDQLYNDCELTREAQSGQLPIVKLAGVTAEKGQFGTNYRPRFEVVKWVDRPNTLPDAAPKAAMPAKVDESKATSSTGGAPSTGSTLKSAPQAQAQPEPATADADDFG